MSGPTWPRVDVRVVELDRLRLLHEHGDELVEDRPLDIDPLDGLAGLTGVGDRGAEQGGGGAFDVGVGGDDGGVLAAELEKGGDQPLGGGVGDDAAHRDASGEADRVGVVDHHRTDAPDAADHAEDLVELGHPGDRVGEGLDEARGDLARLGDDAAAGGQGRYGVDEGQDERESSTAR